MKKALFGFLILTSASLLAQEKVTADFAAVHSIDGIVKEVLRLISGEAGKGRDMEAFRSLFLPTATFTVHSHDKSASRPVETVSLQEFVSLLEDPYYEQGFLEQEISKVVDEYNGIAHVFQTFYAKDAEGHEEKGINSYQLVYFDGRWWIVNILWTGDSNGVEVPEQYRGN